MFRKLSAAIILFLALLYPPMRLVWDFAVDSTPEAHAQVPSPSPSCLNCGSGDGGSLFPGAEEPPPPGQGGSACNYAFGKVVDSAGNTVSAAGCQSQIVFSDGLVCNPANNSCAFIFKSPTPTLSATPTPTKTSTPPPTLTPLATSTPSLTPTPVVTPTFYPFDSTKVNDTTWGNNTDASIIWSFDPTGTNNPQIKFSDSAIGFDSVSSVFFANPIWIQDDAGQGVRFDKSTATFTSVGTGVIEANKWKIDPAPCPTGPPQQFCLDTDINGKCLCGVPAGGSLATSTPTITSSPTPSFAPSPADTSSLVIQVWATPGPIVHNLLANINDSFDASKASFSRPFPLSTATAFPPSCVIGDTIHLSTSKMLGLCINSAGGTFTNVITSSLGGSTANRLVTWADTAGSKLSQIAAVPTCAPGMFAKGIDTSGAATGCAPPPGAPTATSVTPTPTPSLTPLPADTASIVLQVWSTPGPIVHNLVAASNDVFDARNASISYPFPISTAAAFPVGCANPGAIMELAPGADKAGYCSQNSNSWLPIVVSNNSVVSAGAIVTYAGTGASKVNQVGAFPTCGPGLFAKGIDNLGAANGCLTVPTFTPSPSPTSTLTTPTPTITFTPNPAGTSCVNCSVTYDASGRITSSVSGPTLYTRIRYTSSNTKTSNTTLSNDSGGSGMNLTGFNVVPNVAYKVEAHLLVTSPPTAGIRISILGPATSTCFLNATNLDSNSPNSFAASDCATTAGSMALATVTSWDSIYISGMLYVTSPGVVNLQWAQNVSNAGSTYLNSGSWMTLEMVVETQTQPAFKPAPEPEPSAEER